MIKYIAFFMTFSLSAMNAEDHDFFVVKMEALKVLAMDLESQQKYRAAKTLESRIQQLAQTVEKNAQNLDIKALKSRIALHEKYFVELQFGKLDIDEAHSIQIIGST